MDFRAQGATSESVILLKGTSEIFHAAGVISSQPSGYEPTAETHLPVRTQDPKALQSLEAAMHHQQDYSSVAMFITEELRGPRGRCKALLLIG